MSFICMRGDYYSPSPHMFCQVFFLSQVKRDPNRPSTGSTHFGIFVLSFFVNLPFTVARGGVFSIVRFKADEENLIACNKLRYSVIGRHILEHGKSGRAKNSRKERSFHKSPSSPATLKLRVMTFGPWYRSPCQVEYQNSSWTAFSNSEKRNFNNNGLHLSIQTYEVLFHYLKNPLNCCLIISSKKALVSGSKRRLVTPSQVLLEMKENCGNWLPSKNIVKRTYC